MATAVETLYEYRAVKVQVGDGQIDEKKTQEALDSMSKDGWRLICTQPEMVSGTSRKLMCIWERAKQ